MKEELVNYIIYPICEGTFNIKVKEKNEEIIKGLLVCDNKHRFEIKGGIPV